jgi:SAM-dependent methyltransferase
MTNIEAWDRVAARRGESGGADVVEYGPDLPTEAELRLLGDVAGKRVLDLGCGAGENAIAMSRLGAHVIALDVSPAQLSLGKRRAAAAEVRVEWHESDAADLAFLRADSIDVALAAGVVHEIEDFDRMLRQVQRVLRPGAAFVFSHDHPMRLAVARDADGGGAGALPLGRLEVRRSYFDPSPIIVTRDDEAIQMWPRTLADVFSALHRAGYRVDVLLEPEPVRSSDPGPSTPTSVIWRARKEGS